MCWIPFSFGYDVSYDAGRVGSSPARGVLYSLSTKDNCKDDDDDDENTFDFELRPISRLYEAIRREDARRRHCETLDLVGICGGDSRLFDRERSQAVRAIVAELYSPPRVSDLARRMPQCGLSAGFALDLTDGLDLTREDRDRAEALLRETRPMLSIVLPMCTSFSTWQLINDQERPRDIADIEKKYALLHLD